jgi:hypothetical protein
MMMLMMLNDDAYAAASASDAGDDADDAYDAGDDAYAADDAGDDAYAADDAYDPAAADDAYDAAAFADDDESSKQSNAGCYFLPLITNSKKCWKRIGPNIDHNYTESTKVTDQSKLLLLSKDLFLSYKSRHFSSLFAVREPLPPLDPLQPLWPLYSFHILKVEVMVGIIG